MAEMLRAGEFTDEVVVNLINSRFVPIFFNMAPSDRKAGDPLAYDKDAVDTIGPKKVVVTMEPGVIVSPDAKSVEPVSVQDVPKQFVRELLNILRKHPECAEPGPEERKIEESADQNPEDARAQLESARAAWLAADWDRCLKRLQAARKGAKDDPWTSEIAYLEGRVAHWQGDLDKAEKLFDEAEKRDPQDKTGLADDILCMKGRVALDAKRFEAALVHLNGVIEKHPRGDRIGEALYYAGLGCHFLKDRDKARELWKRHVTEFPKDRLARRSASALFGPAKNRELVDRRDW